MNSVRGLVATLGGTLTTCSLKNQSTITLSSTEAENIALLSCAQEVKFVNMLLKEMSKVHKPEIVYEDNQGAVFLAKNRQDFMCTKHINIGHHFLRGVVEESDMDIKYIISKESPAEIMMNNCSEAGHAKHAKIITEGEV